MVYNLTNITNANNLLEVTAAVNSLTGGLFWALTMITLFIIVLIASINKYDIRKVLVVDSLFISLIGFLGLALGMCQWWIILVPIIIFIGSLIALLTEK